MHYIVTEDQMHQISLVKETLDTMICLNNTRSSVQIPNESLTGALELMRQTLHRVCTEANIDQ